MRTVTTVLGNVHDDPDLAAARERHADAGTLERVAIDVDERVKSRLRVTTDAGTDLGIVVDGPELRDGDVLVADDDCLIVVRFADREAIAIDLPAGATVATALDLGHRIGNQHWDLAIDDGTAYVPLDADRRIVEDVLADALPEGATTRVEPVDASLFVDGAGDDGTDHSHAGDHGHVTGDGDGHGHGDGLDHSHGADPDDDHGDAHRHGDEHDHAHAHHDGDSGHTHADGDHTHADGDEHDHAHAHYDADGNHTHHDDHSHADHDASTHGADDPDGEQHHDHSGETRPDSGHGGGAEG